MQAFQQHERLFWEIYNGISTHLLQKYLYPLELFTFCQITTPIIMYFIMILCEAPRETDVKGLVRGWIIFFK